MSRAVVFDAYGGPEVLHVVDGPVPVPGPGQVLVAIAAAGVQPVDLLLRSGAAHAWAPAQFPQRLGNEFAGTVVTAGDGVTRWRPGDEVIGWAVLACYAEHAVVAAGDMVAKPPGMPWPQAGALSASGQTASSALEHLGVTAGATLLVHGGSGGVGSMAVQLAVADGIRVVATAAAEHQAYLRDLGAVAVTYGDGVTDRIRTALADIHSGQTDPPVAVVDAALDTSGSATALRASLDLGIPPERIGTVSAQGSAAELGLRRLSTQRSTERLRDLTARWERGTLRVHVHRTYPLAEAAAAHTALATTSVRGKLVIVP